MRTSPISILAGLAVFASAVSPALAHDSLDLSVRASVSASPRINEVIKDLRTQFHGEVKQERQDTKSDIQAKRDALKVKVEAERLAKQKERVKGWAIQAVRRLNGLIERLTKTATKIEARINVLAAAGKNVTQLRADLAATRVKISVAQTAVNAMPAQADVLISANTPKDAFKKLHDLEKDVIAKIRDAQQSLVKLLKDTQALRVSVSVSPSASPSSSPSPTPTPTP